MEPLSAILGSIVGFGGAAINNFFEMKKQKEQNKHDLEMARVNSANRIKEYEQSAIDREHERNINHDLSVDGLRALVRPVLTFGIVGIALLLGFAGVVGLIANFDSALFLNWLFAAASTILTFYFGCRSFEKADHRRFIRGNPRYSTGVNNDEEN